MLKRARASGAHARRRAAIGCSIKASISVDHVEHESAKLSDKEREEFGGDHGVCGGVKTSAEKDAAWTGVGRQHLQSRIAQTGIPI